MYCSNCGFEVNNEDNFCTNCGNQVPEGTKFCPSCGTPIIAKETEPAETI